MYVKTGLMDASNTLYPPQLVAWGYKYWHYWCSTGVLGENGCLNWPKANRQTDRN